MGGSKGKAGIHLKYYPEKIHLKCIPGKYAHDWWINL